MGAVKSKTPGVFFIDGLVGARKMFLYHALLVKACPKGRIILATAPSGIAAILMHGGRTAHSRFKIPIKLGNGSFYRITKQSNLAALSRETDLIIWDGAPMATFYLL